jgi:hypothetical protein
VPGRRVDTTAASSSGSAAWRGSPHRSSRINIVVIRSSATLTMISPGRSGGATGAGCLNHDILRGRDGRAWSNGAFYQPEPLSVAGGQSPACGKSSSFVDRWTYGQLAPRAAA